VYDPANLTVTLHPEQRISIHDRYELIIDGTAPHGLTNTRGLLLDGTGSGSPDSDYRASLTWRNLVLDPPGPNTSRRSRRTTVQRGQIWSGGSEPSRPDHTGDPAKSLSSAGIVKTSHLMLSIKQTNGF